MPATPWLYEGRFSWKCSCWRPGRLAAPLESEESVGPQGSRHAEASSLLA